MAGKVAKVYGGALFEAAREKGNLQELTEESAALRKILAENAELSAFLNHPQIDQQEKKETLKAIFQGRLSGELLGLLDTVLEKGRQKWLDGILLEFEQRSREFRGVGQVLVEAPVEPDEGQKRRIEDRLLATTKFKSLEITYKIKPELIGGLVIRIGDRVADSSVKTRLEQLKGQLLALRLPEEQERR